MRFVVLVFGADHLYLAKGLLKLAHTGFSFFKYILDNIGRGLNISDQTRASAGGVVPLATVNIIGYTFRSGLLYVHKIHSFFARLV